MVQSIGDDTNLTVVDVGAHEGRFTEGVAALCGVRRGVLCEANPAWATVLRQKYRRPIYDVVEAAICRCDGELEFNVAEFDAISSILPILQDSSDLAVVDTRNAPVTVQSTTLDRALEGLDIGHIDLLKIDVQGAEVEVLAGAHETLKATDRIWLEVSLKPLYRGSALFPEVYSYLVDRGFALAELEPGFRGPRGELIQLDLLFLPAARIGS